MHFHLKVWCDASSLSFRKQRSYTGILWFFDVVFSSLFFFLFRCKQRCKDILQNILCVLHFTATKEEEEKTHRFHFNINFHVVIEMEFYSLKHFERAQRSNNSIFSPFWLASQYNPLLVASFATFTCTKECATSLEIKYATENLKWGFLLLNFMLWHCDLFIVMTLLLL